MINTESVALQITQPYKYETDQSAFQLNEPYHPI